MHNPAVVLPYFRVIIMQIVIVSGLSGSGKSVALNTFEDLGYYCTDNLPIELLPQFVQSPSIAMRDKVAVGADVRGSRRGLTELPDQIKAMKQSGHDVILLYLHADKSILLKRYNETRRKHPLYLQQTSLQAALDLEQAMLVDIRSCADLDIDTTYVDIYQLADLLKRRVAKQKRSRLSLMFQSFGFKYGAPSDTDFIFDVRCLPNPYWVESLRLHSGLEKPVMEWLDEHDKVHDMKDDLTNLAEKWIPEFIKNQRAYLTFSIGCTGGKHRSVFITERLTEHFQGREKLDVLSFHREL